MQCHLDLLNISEDWLKYAVRLHLMGEAKEDLTEARNAALKDSRIQALLDDVAHFHEAAITSHKNPDLAIYKLLFLLDIGFDTAVLQIQLAINQIKSHKDANGVYPIAGQHSPPIWRNGQSSLWLVIVRCAAAFAGAEKGRSKLRKAFETRCRLPGFPDSGKWQSMCLVRGTWELPRPWPERGLLSLRRAGHG